MASPFRIFRKYMKTLMVVFGVLIMFSFVVLDPMVTYLGGGRAGAGNDAGRDADDVAVSWADGSLTNAELSQLTRRRRILNSFLMGVEHAGAQAAYEAGGDPLELQTPPVSRLTGPETPEQGIEQSVVQTQLFADAAREAGMRVSDDMIGAYLDELGRGRVSPDQLDQMLTQLGGGRKLPAAYIREAIRDEMLARNFLASHSYAFQTVTPEQAYQDWLRVNDRIVIEAAPVPAEKFLVDVPEPSQTELAGFFDEHKSREPQPVLLGFPGGGQMEFPSPIPGFRIPRKVDVQFIEANYDEFLAKVEAEVTEEEIAKYYEDNKDPLFIKADTDLIDDVTTPDEPADTPATSEATPPSTEATEPATETTEQPAEEAAADEAATSDSETEAPAQDGDGDVDTAPEDRDQSFIPLPGGLLALTALVQQSNNDDPPPAADASATTEPPASDKPATELAQDTAENTAEEKPVEFQPLDEVRDQIRRDLARGRATDKLDELMNQLYSELNAEWTKYFSMQLEAQAADRAAPAPPESLANLATLVEKHGLKHGKTGPLSFLELRAGAVGKSADSQGQPVWAIFFGNSDIDPYQPVTTEDADANRYLVMKTSDTPGRIPELAEVRDEVVRAWKLEKAAELAEKYATEQAKKAQESRRPLGEFLTGGVVGEVVRTDPFAQYTGGDVAYATRQLEPFRLSEPDGIVAAGPDFMDKVFELKEGEVTAVMNHDHSIAYVVRLVEHQLSPEELHTAYLAEAGIWPGSQIMTGDRFQRSHQLLAAEVLAGAGLEWQRTPDQLLQDEE